LTTDEFRGNSPSSGSPSSARPINSRRRTALRIADVTATGIHSTDFVVDHGKKLAEGIDALVLT
jgi:hypothetical protein